MTWFGKVVGGAFGFVMGGPVGAALGAALGHQIDRDGLQSLLPRQATGSDEPQSVRMAFFQALFPVMGHVAKADGRVSEAEIEVARRIMGRMMLSSDLQATAMRLYNEGKQGGERLEFMLDRMSAECRGRAPLRRLFIELLTESAMADGIIHPAAEAELLRVCDRLRFSRFELIGIRTRLEAEMRLARFNARANRYYQHRQAQVSSGAHDQHEAYATLGLSPGADNNEVKRAYRRLIGQNHPDKLAARGLSEARMQKATETTQKIQKAYDVIRKSRKF